MALSFESDAKPPPPGMLQTTLKEAVALSEAVPWSGMGVALAPPGMVTRLWSTATPAARSWQLTAVKVEPVTARITAFDDRT
jgi:hypothetical protein